MSDYISQVEGDDVVVYRRTLVPIARFFDDAEASAFIAFRAREAMAADAEDREVERAAWAADRMIARNELLEQTILLDRGWLKLSDEGKPAVVPSAPPPADFHPAPGPGKPEAPRFVEPISTPPASAAEDPDAAYKARLMEALEEAKTGAPPMMLAEKYNVSAKALGGQIGLWKRHHATAEELAEFERGRDMHALAALEGRA